MRRVSLVFCVAVGLVLFGLQSQIRAEEGFGTFNGDLIVKLEGDGRTVELMQPFAFTDPAGKTWSVPAGTVVDGASIPQAFWTVIGGPFEGKYREASVVHDYYCVRRSETWQNVHLVFYNGMRANGVGSLTAKVMYAAVYNFGPRWLEVDAASGAAIAGQPLLREDVKQAIIKRITDGDPSIEEIQRISDELSQIKSVDELERLLSENGQCTPIVDENLRKTLILCGMTGESKRLAAQQNVQNLAEKLNALLSAQSIFLLPAVQSYANDPTPEKWLAVQKATKDVFGLIKVAARATVDAGESSDPAIKEHADAIFGILGTRTSMLGELQARPDSRDALLEWNSKYGGLVRRLAAELAALQTVMSQQPR